MGRGDQGLLSGAAGGTYVFRWFECPEICALGRSRVVVAKDKIEMPAGSNVEYSAQEMCQAEAEPAHGVPCRGEGASAIKGKKQNPRPGS